MRRDRARRCDSTLSARLGRGSCATRRTRGRKLNRRPNATTEIARTSHGAAWGPALVTMAAKTGGAAAKERLSGTARRAEARAYVPEGKICNGSVARVMAPTPLATP
nr:hypothetical protein [Methylobacterium currus]